MWRRRAAEVGLQLLVDVLKRRGRRVRWADGEAEAVGLIRTVVWVLTCDDDFDGIEGCMPRPIDD